MLCIFSGETSPGDHKNCLTPIKKVDFVSEKASNCTGRDLR